jgi:Flp pilus assembly pilin Flp
VSKKGEAVMKRILGYLKDERGIETLEWIAIGALILGVAFAVYPGTLQTGLTTVVNNVVTALTGVVIAPPAP